MKKNQLNGCALVSEKNIRGDMKAGLAGFENTTNSNLHFLVANNFQTKELHQGKDQVHSAASKHGLRAEMSGEWL